MGNKTFYWDGLNGMTLHSYLKLPIGSKRLTELKGVALQQPQNNLENVEYLIIHKYSLVGQSLLGFACRNDLCCS